MASKAEPEDGGKIEIEDGAEFFDDDELEDDDVEDAVEVPDEVNPDDDDVIAAKDIPDGPFRSKTGRQDDPKVKAR